MDDGIDSLRVEMLFSTAADKSGYWQISAHESNREKAKFISHHGLYQFSEVPLGLRNDPATFQRAVNVIPYTAK